MTGVADRGSDWRAEATSRLLPLVAENPLLLEIGSGTPEAIVRCDVAAICRSSVVLAYVGIPSWGTAMELWQAKQLGVPVVAWVEMDYADTLSPWVRYCISHGVHYDLMSAVATVRRMFRDKL
jgi:hypothetical protein